MDNEEPIPLVNERWRALAAFREKIANLPERVRIEARRRLPYGEASRAAVAKALGMSARTMTRRLREQDTSYTEIVDRLRLTLAREYLKDPSVPIACIAFELGYAEGSAFSHAYARWTGRAPTAERAAGRDFARPC
jgi:transcriptional regulator GlxA family with amidase domain